MFCIGNYPFVRILLPYMAGIAVSDRLWGVQTGALLWLLPFALFLCLSLWVHRAIPNPGFSYRWLFGLILSLLLFLLGFLSFRPANGIPERFPGKNVACSEAEYCLAIVEKPLQRKTNSLTGILRVFADGMDGLSVTRVVACFAPDSASQYLQPGDTIVFRAAVRQITAPQNPDAFDYQKYMRRKGIGLSVWLGEGSWLLHGKGDRGKISRGVLAIRDGLVEAISSANMNSTNKGLAQALMIGVKDDLDEEVSSSFSAAGAIHVLCVSGLHVGMIFVIFSSVFGFLKRIRKWGNLIFTLCGIGVIWCYALITGLPPSVNRASIMFTFILLSKLAGRKNQTMNSVAASAFIILVSDPSLLFHVGFQLSYLAVAGIITLFPVLSSLWTPRWRIMVSVRDLLVVSFCAQLFTFPVATSAFHLFPNYFLLTNLLVLPITSIVIWAGVAFLVAGIDPMHRWFTFVFDQLLSLMRHLVGFVDALPGSSSQGVYLTPLQVWFLLGVAVAVTFWLHGAGKRWLFATLSGVVLVLAAGLHHENVRNHQDVVVVYHVKKGSVVDVLNGRNRTTFLGDDSLSPVLSHYAADAFRIRSGVYHSNRMGQLIVCHPDENLLLESDGCRLLLVRTGPRRMEQEVSCDYALAGPRLWPDTALFSLIRANCWVIDGSVPFYKVDQWKKAAEEAGVNLWVTSEQGALIISKNKERNR
jgi:competence protein ComEC